MCSCKLLKPCCLSLSVCKLKNKVKRGKHSSSSSSCWWSTIWQSLSFSFYCPLPLSWSLYLRPSNLSLLLSDPLYLSSSLLIPLALLRSIRERFTLSNTSLLISSSLFLSSPPSLYLYLYLPSSHLLSYIFHISLFFSYINSFLLLLSSPPFQ